MIRLYIIGVSILITAIIANGIVIKLGIVSWYDFLNQLSANGFEALKSLNVLDYLWLFVSYPMVLGLGYWIGERLFSTFS